MLKIGKKRQFCQLYPNNDIDGKIIFEKDEYGYKSIKLWCNEIRINFILKKIKSEFNDDCDMIIHSKPEADFVLNFWDKVSAVNNGLYDMKFGIITKSNKIIFREWTWYNPPSNEIFYCDDFYAIFCKSMGNNCENF